MHPSCPNFGVPTGGKLGITYNSKKTNMPQPKSLVASKTIFPGLSADTVFWCPDRQPNISQLGVFRHITGGVLSSKIHHTSMKRCSWNNGALSIHLGCILLHGVAPSVWFCFRAFTRPASGSQRADPTKPKVMEVDPFAIQIKVGQVGDKTSEWDRVPKIMGE